MTDGDYGDYVGYRTGSTVRGERRDDGDYEDEDDEDYGDYGLGPRTRTTARGLTCPTGTTGITTGESGKWYVDKGQWTTDSYGGLRGPTGITGR